MAGPMAHPACRLSISHPLPGATADGDPQTTEPAEGRCLFPESCQKSRYRPGPAEGQRAPPRPTGTGIREIPGGSYRSVLSTVPPWIPNRVNSAGIGLPDFASASFTTKARPVQQGTSMIPTWTSWISFCRNISVSFSR